MYIKKLVLKKISHVVAPFIAARFWRIFDSALLVFKVLLAAEEVGKI